MRNKESWQPSKFAMTHRGLRGSRDPRELGRGSRFIGDILARTYEDALRRHATGRLLDLGCGKVPLYEAYRDLIDDNVCVDWAQTRNQSPFLDHEQDLNQPLSFADASFDTIVATDVLEHIVKPDRLWREMTRILRPGGKLILGVPFFYPIHEQPHDYHRYTGYKLRHFCEEHGLAVLQLDAYGGWPEVTLDMTAKLLGFSAVLSAVHLLIAQTFMRLPLIGALSRTSATSYPLGYCLVAQKPEDQGAGGHAGATREGISQRSLT